MGKIRLLILLIVLGLMTSVYTYCTVEKAKHAARCSLRVHCLGSIRGSLLPMVANCNASATNVDVTLTDAVERFDEPIIDSEFHKSITNLKVSANWPHTHLAQLKYTPALRDINLSNNNITKIHGQPFYYLKNLEKIDVSHNNIADISNLFRLNTPNELRILVVSFNAITNIPSRAFQDLTSLRYLDLAYNNITDLTSEPFNNLTKLEVLILDNNGIKDLNGAFSNLNNLMHLYLRGNQIQNINKPSLKVIYHLKTFDISGNELGLLRPVIFQRHWERIDGICRIILANNNISSIPSMDHENSLHGAGSSFRFNRDVKNHKVRVLTELDLSYNSLEDIRPDAFHFAIHLVTLDLSHNKLTDFIADSNDIKYIENLNLSWNKLTNLYIESFSSMTELQNLNLKNNDLHYIPDKTFVNNKILRNINMAYNNIIELDKLNIEVFNSKGGTLDLTHNGLTRLHLLSLEGLRLTSLLLDSNNIDDIHNIDLLHLSQLTAFSISRNNIERLNKTSIKIPPNLQILDISYNKIQLIEPNTFDTLCHLVNLNLAHNKLFSLEFGALQGLFSVRKLDISYNNLFILDSNNLMDMKQLNMLFLQHNGLRKLDYRGWLGHKQILNVYLEGNNITCDWLNKALHDFNSGYSNMRPSVMHKESSSKHSIENVPCVQKGMKSEKLENFNFETEDVSAEYVLADERLLVTNQKILQAVQEQTSVLSQCFNKLIALVQLNSWRK